MSMIMNDVRLLSEQEKLGMLQLAIRDQWSPPPLDLPSELAERNRIVSPKTSPHQGKWKNDRAPYLVQPLDHISEYDPCERIICMFSSQTGKTEMLLNAINYIIQLVPGPVLVIQPNTEPMGEAFSKERLSPMLSSSEELRSRVASSRSRDSASTILHKDFVDGQLDIAGAASPASLASRPIRYFLGDELDRWVSSKEGDPLSLARKRMQVYLNAGIGKEMLVSSPTFPKIGIHAEYRACGMRWQWMFPCDCGEWQFPLLRHFRYDIDDSSEIGNVRYVCEHCGIEHEERYQDQLKESARWKCIKIGSNRSNGYHVSQFASGFALWRSTLREWELAKGDALKEQVVTNTCFAMPWEGGGEKIDADSLGKRAEDWGEEIPDLVRSITIGVDVQKDRMEYEVVGWGAGEESWSLEYGILVGSPIESEVWSELNDLVKRSWRRKDGNMQTWAGLAIDSGNWTKEVYSWVAEKRKRTIIPVKGASPFDAPALNGTRIERRRRTAKRMVSGGPAEIIGVSQLKLSFFHRLGKQPGRPGYCHFPAGRPGSYYTKLTGERLTRVKKFGKAPSMAFVRVEDNVEPLDCRIYATAALYLCEIKLGGDPIGLHAAKSGGAMPTSSPVPPPQRTQGASPRGRPRPRRIR